MRPSNAGSGRRPANWQLNIRALKNGFRADSKRANEPESPTTSSSTNTSKNFRSPNTTGYRKRCGKFFWKNAMHKPFRITILDAQKIIGRRNYTFPANISAGEWQRIPLRCSSKLDVLLNIIPHGTQTHNPSLDGFP